MADTNLSYKLIKRHFDEFPQTDQAYQMVAGLAQNGGFGLPPNIMDTWLAIEVLKSCSLQVLNLASVATFVNQLQHPSLGFAITLTSRAARLDVMTAGVRAALVLVCQ